MDIIQAVGRAIRLSPDKKAGTIVLPVFINAGEDAVGTIEASNFKPIWEVLNALKAHDDVLACELDQIRTELGKKPGTGVSADGLRKITLDLPVTVDASFGSALRTYLVEQVTASWNFWFGLLEAFVEREGHSKAPKDYKTADGYQIGYWVATQRAFNSSQKLSKDRKLKLEALKGWTWEPHAEQWNEGYEKLKRYSKANGHCLVPITFKNDDEFRLGQWVSVQRGSRAKGTLPADRKNLLETLPGWS